MDAFGSCKLCDGRVVVFNHSIGESPPVRLASRKVSSGSDWIKGTDYGLCRGAVTVSSNPFETNLSCHWKVGDRTNFSSCESSFPGQVVSVSSHKSKIELTDDLAIGQSGMIESQDGFYCIYRLEKREAMRFGRTPEESGNSLELLNGIERLSISRYWMRMTTVWWILWTRGMDRLL